MVFHWKENQGCCGVGGTVQVSLKWARRVATSEPRAPWRPYGQLQPDPAGLSFPLQPSAPATPHGPPGLLQEHQTASRPRFPRSFSPFPCNSLIPRYVWAGSVASLNKHQNRRRPCSDTDCGSVPRVPNPQGLSHRSAWILKDIKIEKDSLELIVLSEVSQRAKDKYHMISLACRI